jgi:hypothetical protein
VDRGETYKRPRKSDIEFLWIQLEDIIEHNINKDAKTKLELLQRLCQLLTKRGERTNKKGRGVVRR